MLYLFGNLSWPWTYIQPQKMFLTPVRNIHVVQDSNLENLLKSTPILKIPKPITISKTLEQSWCNHHLPDPCQECPCHPRLHPGELSEIYSDFENSQAYHYLQDLSYVCGQPLSRRSQHHSSRRSQHFFRETSFREKSYSFKMKSASLKEKKKTIEV